jgi:hypothetical protein
MERRFVHKRKEYPEHAREEHDHVHKTERTKKWAVPKRTRTDSKDEVIKLLVLQNALEESGPEGLNGDVGGLEDLVDLLCGDLVAIVMKDQGSVGAGQLRLVSSYNLWWKNGCEKLANESRPSPNASRTRKEMNTTAFVEEIQCFQVGLGTYTYLNGFYGQTENCWGWSFTARVVLAVAWGVVPPAAP